jgi:hypothetical protein
MMIRRHGMDKGGPAWSTSAALIYHRQSLLPPCLLHRMGGALVQLTTHPPARVRFGPPP